MGVGNSIMWRYIDEEPAVLARVSRAPEIDSLAREIGGGLKAVYFVAHGSSFNAAVATADFMARTAGLRVYACTPANFCGNFSSLEREEKSGAVVVTISQTGTSSGAIGALERAEALGFRTIGITDIMDSPVAAKATWVLPLLCGREDSNAKTKGYSATLLVLLRFAAALGRVRGTLTEDEAADVKREFAGMIEAIPKTKKTVLDWCEKHDFGKTVKDLYVLGSGMNFGTSQEGQLKLMETMCIPTMFNDIGEFSHGMHRSITDKSSLLLFRADDGYGGLTADTFRYLKGITKNVLLVDASEDKVEDDLCIPVPAFPRTQSLLLTTLAVQVLSVYGPENLGDDPNRNAHNDFTEAVHTRVG